MTLENVTKEEWDAYFKEGITAVEEQITDLMNTYQSLLKLRSEYRKDYETNRIIHNIDFDEGILTYTKGANRTIGYRIHYTKKK